MALKNEVVWPEVKARVFFPQEYYRCEFLDTSYIKDLLYYSHWSLDEVSTKMRIFELIDSNFP